MNRACATCYWWGLYSTGEHGSAGTGPFPDEKPAKYCKRFPPTNQWGATNQAQAHGVGKSVLTFHNDFCGEWKKRE